MSAVLTLLAGILLAAIAWSWSLRSVEGATRVAIVAVLGVTAAAFNVVVPIPSVEAYTTVVLCTAIALGPRMGAAAGLVAIVASSVTGGIGTWTIWQVVSVALVALLGSALAVTGRSADWFAPRRLAVLAVGAALGALAWDVVTTAGSMATIAPGQSVIAALLIGVAFTATHVVFSTAFTVIGGPPLLHTLARARHRLDGGVVTG